MAQCHMRGSLRGENAEQDAEVRLVSNDGDARPRIVGKYASSLVGGVPGASAEHSVAAGEPETLMTHTALRTVGRLP